MRWYVSTVERRHNTHLNAGNEWVNPALNLLCNDTLGGVQLGQDWGVGVGGGGRVGECTETVLNRLSVHAASMQCTCNI